LGVKAMFRNPIATYLLGAPLHLPPPPWFEQPLAQRESTASLPDMDKAPNLPGMSVVLKDDPKGPVMTVTDIRLERGTRIYTVVWLDVSKTRQEAEFPEAALMRMAS
jgi:hypothetical protein